MFHSLQASMQTQEKHVLAFDIETSGSFYQKNGILSVGASLQNEDSVEKLSFQTNIQLPDGCTYEPDCVENFWNKNPEAKAFVEKDALPPQESMTQFARFLDEVEEKFPNTILVSDNPSFDIAWLDNYLSLYAGRKPLRYTRAGKYRMVWDSSSIQKTWLCMKLGISSLVAPSDHREKLGIVSPFTHDHNPLNDARTIAYFYIQTIKQMQKFIEELPKPQPTRKIELAEYSSEWPKIFAVESAEIKGALCDVGVDVLHVGSTSVPGLLAKPIIDIIAVVKHVSPDLDERFSKAGYRYKGEYNLPLRRMYGKKLEGKEIYLHVHEQGSPEIDLNVIFRDYLIANEDARKEYTELKKSIVEADSSHAKVGSTGITTYNLGKNDFIQGVLKSSRFSGLCPRLCTQANEWSAYNEMRKAFLKGEALTESEIKDPDQKHLVLYRGTDIIAAAQLQLKPPTAYLVFSAFRGDVKDRSSLVAFIEKWISRMGVRFLTTTIPSEEHASYLNEGFIIVGSSSQRKDLFKYLP